MIIVLQRVARAACTVAGEVTGRIETGYCLFVCGVKGDTAADVVWLADKVVDLRLFADAEGRTNLSLQDVTGSRKSVLVVPQFTLAADWRKGRRPSFTRSASPDEGERLVGVFERRLTERGVGVARGRFGAEMSIELLNQGPFTLVLDSSVRPVAESP